MISLGEDGLLKVKAGMTTPQELLRVVTEVRETRTVCSECGTRVAPDFTACPTCGHRVGGGCPHCRRPIQPEWKFCPYCAKNTDAAPSITKRTSRGGLSSRRPVAELPAGNIAEFKKGS
jgi:RNA polymerase subunit RPABC4/transcription elongation factor Spt4